MNRDMKKDGEGGKEERGERKRDTKRETDRYIILQGGCLQAGSMQRIVGVRWSWVGRYSRKSIPGWSLRAWIIFRQSRRTEK